MKEARIYVDFNEMVEGNLIVLSKNDLVIDSKGKVVKLKAGMQVKLYSDDLSSCGEKDNLIANGIVELNSFVGGLNNEKWYCRLDDKGIYNESQA